MANLSPEELRLNLDYYSERAEQWQVDHDKAMSCRNLEDIIAWGLSLFFAIDMIDVHWREALFSNKAKHDPVDEEEICGYYRTWLSPAAGMLRRIAEMEAAGYTVKWAEQFRRACHDAEAALTPDAEYFTDDLLIERRDSAIDAHRGGQTVEFHELGD